MRPYPILAALALSLAAAPVLAQTAAPPTGAGRYGPTQPSFAPLTPLAAPVAGAPAEAGRLLSWAGKSPPISPASAAAAPDMAPKLLDDGVLAHSSAVTFHPVALPVPAATPAPRVASSTPIVQAPIAPPVAPRPSAAAPTPAALSLNPAALANPLGANAPDGLLGGTPTSLIGVAPPVRSSPAGGVL